MLSLFPIFFASAGLTWLVIAAFQNQKSYTPAVFIGLSIFLGGLDYLNDTRPRTASKTWYLQTLSREHLEMAQDAYRAAGLDCHSKNVQVQEPYRSGFYTVFWLGEEDQRVKTLLEKVAVMKDKP